MSVYYVWHIAGYTKITKVNDIYLCPQRVFYLVEETNMHANNDNTMYDMLIKFHEHPLRAHEPVLCYNKNRKYESTKEQRDSF